MARYKDRHHVHTGPIGNSESERYIHELAQADIDHGLREAEAYGERPVHPVFEGFPIHEPEGEFYGRTDTGELIGPYGSAEELEAELDKGNLT